MNNKLGGWVIVVGALLGALVVGATPAAAAPLATASLADASVAEVATPSSAGYVPLTPFRVLDTRDGTGALRAPVGAGGSIDVGVVGVGGVPASGVWCGGVERDGDGRRRRGRFVTVWPCG